MHVVSARWDTVVAARASVGRRQVLHATMRALAGDWDVQPAPLQHMKHEREC